MINTKRKPYWLVYYSIPAIIGILAISLFITLFKRNMFCAGDGWLMQYPAAEYAREFWQNVFRGRWTMIDFTIGEGLDPLISMAYYGLTDPMYIPFALCTHNAIPTAYGIVLMLKLFLSGVSFGFYARTKSDDHKAVAMGALVYAFSGFMLFWTFCPGILSAGYLFPLALYAMDKAFDHKGCALFAGITALSYITNYYAGMAISFVLVAYAILRIVYDKMWNKRGVLNCLAIAASHLVGILAASFVLLPVATVVLGGGRGGSAGYADSLLWFNWEYYADLLISMFTPFNNMSVYWDAPYKALPHFICLAVPALLLLLTNKTEKHSNARLLKWALLIGTVFMCVPFFSKLMNMWMYPTHRWAFAFAFVIGLTVVWAIPRFATMSWKIKLASAVMLIGSAAATFLNMRPRAAWATVIAAVVSSLIMLIKPRRLTAYVAGCMSMALFIFATFVGNVYGASFTSRGIQTRQDHIIYAAAEPSDDDIRNLMRVSITDDIDAMNTGMLLGYNTTTAAWNVMPASVVKYNEQVQAFPNREIGWWEYGLDDRTVPHTLAGTKYFVTTERRQSSVPYGFELDRKVTLSVPQNDGTEVPFDCYVYRNQYNPGVGYLYTESLSTEAFEKLDVASRQLALMQYAVIDGAENTTADVCTFQVPIDVQRQDGHITINANIPDGYEAYLQVDKILLTVKASQVRVRGYKYWKSKQPTADDTATLTEPVDTSSSASAKPNGNVVVTATSNSGEKVVKCMCATLPDAHIQGSTPIRTMCLGHQMTGNVTITLDYSEEAFDVGNISLYAMQTHAYRTAAQTLMKNSLADIQHSNRGDKDAFVSGKITATQDGILQVAVPYSSGWRAYIDGEETDVLQCGVKYMGVQMSAGEHEVRFEYTTPGLIPGAIISVVSGLAILAWALLERRKLREHTDEEPAA